MIYSQGVTTLEQKRQDRTERGMCSGCERGRPPMTYPVLAAIGALRFCYECWSNQIFRALNQVGGGPVEMHLYSSHSGAEAAPHLVTVVEITEDRNYAYYLLPDSDQKKSCSTKMLRFPNEKTTPEYAESRLLKELEAERPEVQQPRTAHFGIVAPFGGRRASATMGGTFPGEFHNR